MQTGSICLICILTMNTHSRSICKHRHIQVKLTPDIKNHEIRMQAFIVLYKKSSLKEVHTECEYCGIVIQDTAFYILEGSV